MEENQPGEDATHVETNGERLIKLIVGTTAGFIASRVAENLIESVLDKRRRSRL